MRLLILHLPTGLSGNSLLTSAGVMPSLVANNQYTKNMKARELFKSELRKKITEAEDFGGYPLDLRIEKAPWCNENKDIFTTEELDEAFEYIEHCSEWFVDIYENIWEGKSAHAEYTGVSLLAEEFRNLLNKRPLSAEEKFDARLKELGIYDDWCQQGCVGRVGVETSEGVKIFVHEDEDDRFTEFTYPPMREMEKSDQFRIKALEEFYPAMSDDKEFMSKLVRWVANPANKNPLFPVDVYFLWSDYTWQDFVDDKPAEVVKHGRKWEVLKSYEPNASKDWWVSDFENVGTLYMNNLDGYMVLYEINGTILKSDI